MSFNYLEDVFVFLHYFFFYPPPPHQGQVVNTFAMMVVSSIFTFYIGLLYFFFAYILSYLSTYTSAWRRWIQEVVGKLIKVD